MNIEIRNQSDEIVGSVMVENMTDNDWDQVEKYFYDLDYGDTLDECKDTMSDSVFIGELFAKYVKDNFDVKTINLSKIKNDFTCKTINLSEINKTLYFGD